MRLAWSLALALIVVPLGRAAELAPAAKLDLKLAAECAGSYGLAKDHIIDIGPMGEMGGDLVFLDSKTLRDGHLHQVSAREFPVRPWA